MKDAPTPDLPHGVVPWCDIDVRRDRHGWVIGGRKDDPEASRYKGLNLRVGEGRAGSVAERAWKRAVRRAWRAGTLRFTEDYAAKIRECRHLGRYGPILGACGGTVFGLLMAAEVSASGWADWALFGGGGAAAGGGFFYAMFLSVGRAARDPACRLSATFDSNGITARLGDGAEYRREWRDLDPLQPKNGIRFIDGLRIRLMPHGRGRLVMGEVLEKYTTSRHAAPHARALILRILLYHLLGGVAAWFIGLWMIGQGLAPAGHQFRLAIAVGLVLPLTMALVMPIDLVARHGWGFWRRRHWMRAWRQMLTPAAKGEPRPGRE